MDLRDGIDIANIQITQLCGNNNSNAVEFLLQNQDKIQETGWWHFSENATAIVNRRNQRPNLLPRSINKLKQTTPELIQEKKDANKINKWKQALNGKKDCRCSTEVQTYLDENLPGWRGTDTKEPNKTDKELKPTKKKSMKLQHTTQEAIVTEPKPTPRQNKAELSVLHQHYKTLNSANLHQKFMETPSLWYKYHSLAETNEQTFPNHEVPRNRIIAKLNEIKTKRTKVVVDLGCGKAFIAQHFITDNRFSFINYDHVACNDMVTKCDISAVPLEDNSVEICILSLAMWGSNCKEYVKEAYRILETNGTLYIVEPTKRWSSANGMGTEREMGMVSETANGIVSEAGNKLIELIEENNFRIVEKSVEKFCMLSCVKV